MGKREAKNGLDDKLNRRVGHSRFAEWEVGGVGFFMELARGKS